MGCHVGVMTSGGSWVTRFRQAGIRVHVARNYPTAGKELWRVVRKHNYQVVHANDGSSFRLASASRIHRIAAVYMTVHGRYVDVRTLRACSQHAKGVIASSPSLYQYVLHRGIPASKAYVVANGISTHIFRPVNDHSFRRRYKIPRDAFVIGYAGRFTADKVQLSTRISSILKQYAATRPNTYVLIAGRGSKLFVSSSARCKVIGAHYPLHHFYNNCDVVVGTARVAIESLSCAVPTIAAGYASYIGLVTEANLSGTYRTNFGDHGSARYPWHNLQLVRDLDAIRASQKVTRRNARVLSRIIRYQYSATRMVRRIYGLYNK